jgi:hypothetical protein
VDPLHLLFVPEHVQKINEAAAATVRAIDDVADRAYAAIFRDHPFLQPSDQALWLRQILNRPEVRSTFKLN